MKLTITLKSTLPLIFILATTMISSGIKESKNYMSSESTVFEFMKKFTEDTNTTATKTNIPSPSVSTNLTSPINYVKNLNDPNVQLSDWLAISSNTFTNVKKFPTLSNLYKPKLGSDFQRINEKFDQNSGSVHQFNFWFKIRGGYMYYFATKDDINILGSVLVAKVENSKKQNNLGVIAKNKTFTPYTGYSNYTEQDNTTLETCFNVYDNSNDKYEICALDMQTKLNWLCSLQNFLQVPFEAKCNVGQTQASVRLDSTEVIEIRKIKQPVIIIPMASKRCNENYNYDAKGRDWECNCSEGRSQSPIDLPVKDSAILSNSKPMFQYALISAMSTESSLDGLVTAGEYIKIRYDQNSIKIHHPNMGKIVMEDGGVYVAEEIIFHTPSEHKINNEKFDMEMQVIHYGKSKGDIAKQVVLSFLFKAKPGVYNKFIDKLDFFNLPNPTDNFRDIVNDLFIPNVLVTSDDDDLSSMPPFSFYTYEGSLTAPPCSERTTHLVAADPIYLSNTVITLFKEALKVPDMTNEKGELVQSFDDDKSNNRDTQPLNGRSVYVYDHVKFNCPEFKKKRQVKPAGHYEKREIDTIQYVYVNGLNPSGLPGAFVVTEQEAKGDAVGETPKTEQNK